MKVEVVAATDADKPTMANLMQLYLYEFPYIENVEMGEDGRYRYHYFDRYWAEPGRYPFLIRADTRLAGFALVAERRLIEPTTVGHVMAEFFVLRKCRRRGVGKAAACALFDCFTGPWWVAEHAGNTDGQAFWRAIIDQYTSGRYEEESDVYYGDPVVVQTFDSSPL
jgi:predicted acetyltransferase